MAKSANKTVATEEDPHAFLATLEDEDRRADARRLLALYGEITQQPPVMWGNALIGFGRYHYRYRSGRAGDFMMCGFSPRKRDFSLYVMAGFEGREALLEKLGPHSTGRACLYVKRLEGLHLPTLKRLIRADWREMVRRYGAPAN
ncbi:MAG: DUF1801 domain-containing protein [Pseudomonadales bacterium]|jgi:hypothetical protein|nr:DUF1801 domain-containing protein [Pseudomonadales bacterium]